MMIMDSSPAARGRPHSAYLIRVLISRGDSAEADTEPDSPVDAVPEWQVHGMAAIANAAYDVIVGFHASRHDPAPGLGREKLLGRLPSLRVTLTRGKGDTWWRVPYDVEGVRWVAVVHVVRG